MGLRAFHNEVLKTVKLLDIEERYDLYFSRPLGFLIAKGFSQLKATPTQVSLLSMAIGALAALAFLFQHELEWAIAGCLLLTAAGLLDSADGQLARMTGQSTYLGRIIDGIIDNVVFILCYLGGGFGYNHLQWDWLVFFLGLSAGAAQSYRQMVYEYLKTEYLFYVTGNPANRIERAAAIEASFDRSTLIRRLIYAVYIDYSRKIETIAFRGLPVRDRFESLALEHETRASFVEAYRQTNAGMLYWWAWVGGTNTHRAVMMGAALFGRFDLFFWFSLVAIMPAFFVGMMQQRADRSLLSSFSNR